MTGFSSKRAMATGITDNGVLDPSRTMGWQDMLYRLWLRYGGRGSQGMEMAHERMLMQWPGPYNLEEVYDGRVLSYNYRLKFADPHEELVWILRNT